MTNLTEEDVRFICENLIAPLSEEIANVMDRRDELSAESLGRVFDAVADQLRLIRYEQERDRRFYKAMYTQLLFKNTAVTPDAYDNCYKNWCEEFDKLNKEK